jgi:hypothetical protein
MALSDAERARAYRERRKAGEKLVRYRRPKDRRSKPQQWADATETLLSVLDAYQDWRDNMPPGLAESTTATRCWPCAIWSSSYRRQSCPRASGGTDPPLSTVTSRCSRLVRVPPPVSIFLWRAVTV